jgi:hypothetical protein
LEKEEEEEEEEEESQHTVYTSSNGSMSDELERIWKEAQSRYYPRIYVE